MTVALAPTGPGSRSRVPWTATEAGGSTFLELRAMRAHPLAETHSVDDQVGWLDKTHMLHRCGAGVWFVPSKAGGEPRRFVTDAEGSVVIR